MSGDRFCLQDCAETIEASTSNFNPSSKQRKKRKWDQPDESLVSRGVVLSGMLPMATVGSPGVSLAGIVSASCAPTSSSMQVGCVSVQASVVQQQAAAVVHKLNQPKIQEDLIIAREIVINDADPAMRYKLTKRQTQEEIQKCTGAVVITRGKYRPPNAVPDGEKPLFLHISAGAHLKETAEMILAVDRAAAMVEVMLKQVSQPLSTCVYLGFDADPSLNIAARIHGPNDQYINHIINETGAMVVLRGRDSGYFEDTLGEEGQQPLHLLLSSNNQKSLEDAKLLAENLLDTISRECGANRVLSCKVYNAVPPPQKLLVGIQSSGTELHSNLSSGESLTCSTATSMPGSPLPSIVVPVVRTAVFNGEIMQPGASHALDHALTDELPYSQPSLTACSSYSAYAGIYPQATPLQQVASALRQSGSFSSTPAPGTTASKVMQQCSSEKRKRKFQESPAAFKGVAASQQESQLQALCKCPSSMETNKKDSVLPPPSLSNLLPLRISYTKPSSASRRIPLPSNSLKSMLPPPPPPKSMHSPPPAPMFGSSVSVSTLSDKDDISNRSSSPTVPVISDTLGKLMEYGDEDDDADADTEECENESFKNIAKLVAPSKPFWAV